MEQQPKISGMWLVFFAALLWSTNTPLIKMVHLDPILIAALRALIAGVFLAPFIRPKKLEWNRWLVIYSLSYCLLSLNLIICLKITAATIAVGMQYTGTLWLFLLALHQKKKFPLRTYISMGFIMVGVLLFMLDGSEQSSTVGNLLTISEGIFFAAITYSAQKIGKDNPMGVTAVANLATALIIFAFLPPKLTDLATIPLSVWPIMLFLGIFMVGCGYSLFNIGNKYLSPQNASLMALWELLLGPIWVAIFLKEYPSAIVVCGLAVILCGLTANAFIEKQLKLQLEV